jgi:hypothetical protein
VVVLVAVGAQLARVRPGHQSRRLRVNVFGAIA